MKKYFVLFGVISLFLVGCSGSVSSSTGNYAKNGEHVNWDHNCIDNYDFGVFLKAYERKDAGGEIVASVGFSVRMTDEEYRHYCLD